MFAARVVAIATATAALDPDLELALLGECRIAEVVREHTALADHPQEHHHADPIAGVEREVAPRVAAVERMRDLVDRRRAIAGERAVAVVRPAMIDVAEPAQ